MQNTENVRHTGEKQHTERRTSAETTREIVIMAMFTALTYVFTWLINIRLPLPGTGGLIHLGNVPLFIAAMLFGKKTGAVSGAFGMGLFDLTSGWALWSPFTFAIVGLMGFEVGLFAEKKPIRNQFVNDLVSLIIALGIKVGGYYVAEGIITGNWLAPVGSIPGNVVQVGVASIVVLALAPFLRRALRRSPLSAEMAHAAVKE